MFLFAFNDAIVKSKVDINPSDDLLQLCEYHATLKIVVDKYAPVRSKSVKVKPHATWMSPDIINAEVCRSM